MILQKFKAKGKGQKAKVSERVRSVGVGRK